MRLNTRDIQNITMFENMTNAGVVDFFEEGGNWYFLIKEGDMGKAVGKNGSVISKVRKLTGKRIMLFEDSDEDEKFVRNLCNPIEPRVAISDSQVSIRFRRSDRDEMPGKKMKIVRKFIERKLDADKVEFNFS